MNDLLRAKDLLKTGNFTCVLCKGEKIYTSTHRGVKPLVNWYEEGLNADGFSAADKVIGKATAFLYVLLGIKSVYAAVLSKSALEVLESYNIEVTYTTLAEHIINRTGDGICPFEKAVTNTDNLTQAFSLIKEKMKELNIK